MVHCLKGFSLKSKRLLTDAVSGSRLGKTSLKQKSMLWLELKRELPLKIRTTNISYLKIPPAPPTEHFFGPFVKVEKIDSGWRHRTNHGWPTGSVIFTDLFGLSRLRHPSPALPRITQLGKIPINFFPILLAPEILLQFSFWLWKWVFNQRTQIEPFEKWTQNLISR